MRVAWVSALYGYPRQLPNVHTPAALLRTYPKIRVEVRGGGVNVDHNFRFLHFYTLERSGGGV